MIELVERKEDKTSICRGILRALPEWFGIEQAIADYVDSVQDMPMFVYRFEGESIAFLSLKLHSEYAAEVYVMGIIPAFHRKGIGKELIQSVEIYLKDKGIVFLTVKTLSSAKESIEYEKTRQFYLSVGFLPVEEFPTLWGEDNPCLFLAKSIE